jgi:phosphoesterase RecJ-like protein
MNNNLIDSYKEFKNILQSKNKILVCGHFNPETDCIASSIGMALAIEKLGKHCIIYNEDEIPDVDLFLPKISRITNKIPDENIDLCVIVDCAELERIGKLIDWLKAKSIQIVNIDHHVTNNNFGQINIVEPKASATGEVIYNFLSWYPIKIDKDIAMCLYASILSDTGSFHYSNATPQSFRIASELVEYGINTWEVASNLYENYSFERMQLLIEALATLELSKDNKYASILLTKKMLNQTHTKHSDSDGFINFPRSIKNVVIAIQFRELGDGKFKVSFRSKNNFDVARLAQHFGGGGHHNASGCAVEGDIKTVKEKVYGKIEEELKSEKK